MTAALDTTAAQAAPRNARTTLGDDGHMSNCVIVDDQYPPQVRKALADCAKGARISTLKAEEYLKLSAGESDDTVYEACRSMHRFYSSMQAFFLEEERLIVRAMASPVGVGAAA